MILDFVICLYSTLYYYIGGGYWQDTYQQGGYPLDQQYPTHYDDPSAGLWTGTGDVYTPEGWSSVMYYDYFCWLSINKGFAVKQGLSCMGNTIIVMAKMGGLLYQQKIAILVKI